MLKRLRQLTASEGLALGPYVVARAAFEPTTLWTKGNLPMHHPTPHLLEDVIGK